ncbi:glycosyltransferase WbuB [Aquabacterium sp.]|uniref:glycosyltransferase WbuB n=1 Tax=Aquabacterium sp. TaxID=1872578 RepID=UPI0035B00C7E
MKILLYGLNYAPEPTGIGKYTGEKAAALARLGHSVRVVTAPPYYPAWRVSDGYANRYERTETPEGVQVWRAPLWVPKQPTGLRRVLHLLSFAATSLPVLLRQWAWRPDVVLVVVPALTCVPGALVLARLSGALAWVHVQDFEVDAAYRLGLLKGRVPRALASGLERWLLRRFDRVSTISHKMMQAAAEKGVEAGRRVFLPNWVDVAYISPLKGPSPYRDELGLRSDAVVALFSGTLAGKQGLELLPEVARRLRVSRPHVVLVICGDGVVKPELQAACAGLDNVRFLPLQPFERLNDLLGMADMHLLPQNPGAADVVMPSKLTGMLASGRPVVSTAAPGTELAHVVSQCGVVVPPGSAEGMAEAIAQLADDPARRAELGAKARSYAEQNLALDGVMRHLDAALKQGVASPRDAGALAWRDPHSPAA